MSSHCVFYLTGYLVEEPEPVDIDEMEDLSMESDESASENESSSAAENAEDENFNEPVTLQNLLVGENVPDDDEASDGDWDPSKDNPSPKKKSKKKTAKVKKAEKNEQKQNGVQNPTGVASLLLSGSLPSTDDDNEDYVPKKKDKAKKLDEKKRKFLKRKLKECNKVTSDSPTKGKSKKLKKSPQKSPKKTGFN